MTATEIKGKKVVQVDPILTPLSNRDRVRKDGTVFSTGPVPFTKVVWLTLEDGTKWVGCTVDGCDYVEREVLGNVSVARRVIRGHYHRVHEPVVLPRRTDAEQKGDLLPGTDPELIKAAIRNEDIDALAGIIARQLRTIEVLNEKVMQAGRDKTALEYRIRKLRRGE